MEIDRQFHTPLDVERATQTSDELGWRGRLGNLKSSLVTGVHAVKPMALNRVSVIDSSLRSRPGKWAGIATGAGLLLGIGGRLMRRRAARKEYAHFVLIESC